MFQFDIAYFFVEEILTNNTVGFYYETLISYDDFSTHLPIVDPVKYPFKYFLTLNNLRYSSDGKNNQIIKENKQPLIYRMNESPFRGIPHF